jgi:hypothetical protein
MTDSDLDEGQRRPGRSDKPIIRDWSHPAVGPGGVHTPPWRCPRPGFAELMQDKRGLFADALVRERLDALLARRVADRDAEQGLGAASGTASFARERSRDGRSLPSRSGFISTIVSISTRSRASRLPCDGRRCLWRGAPTTRRI